GSDFGPQMPPTGALPPDQIATIKSWLEQGADWPDAAAGETPPAPVDPAATRLLGLLRRGELSAFKAAARSEGRGAGLRGANGETPLMHAVLYGDLESVRMLLDRGADPNARSDSGATALLWAVNDLDKTRLLLEYGADVNARSDNDRTAIVVAAGRH